jgi:biopolymer transport protein ExbB
MKNRLTTLALLLGLTAFASAQEQVPQQVQEQAPVAPAADANTPTFGSAAATVEAQLQDAVAELNQLRETITAEKLPMNRRLSELEAELTRVRGEFQQTARKLDSVSLAVTNLTVDTQRLEAQERYLSGLLSDYVRKFDASLHIAELARFEALLKNAQLAPENANLSSLQVFQAQTALLSTSLERLEEALGGVRFEGTAVDSTGVVQQGAFLQVGPVVLFRSADGRHVGTVEERLGSQAPTIFPYSDPKDIADASQLISTGAGLFPIDPTMGDAHKMEQTKETLVEHIRKGGPVMWPILSLAGAALLVALYKWFYLASQRRPSQAKVEAFLAAVRQNDVAAIKERAAQIKGPIGRMLAVGVEHLREPRELVEEAMFESVLTTKQKLQGMLPFVAIAASSAPLLGLLGTVTGIINTFKRITVFGSGDVKSLSGGISEALITTEWGLIVAIPALLIHAFLSRKARGIVGQMESTAVAFVNELSRAQLERPPAPKAAERRPVVANA